MFARPNNSHTNTHLPIGKEHHSFDDKKLRQRFPFMQVLMHGVVQEHEAIDRPHLRDVIDQGDPPIGA